MGAEETVGDVFGIVGAVYFSLALFPFFSLTGGGATVS